MKQEYQSKIATVWKAARMINPIPVIGDIAAYKVFRDDDSKKNAIKATLYLRGYVYLTTALIGYELYKNL
jgi:hypothetical protein